MKRHIPHVLSLLLFLSSLIYSQVPAPEVDHHQHLFSPPLAEFQKIGPITADDLIKLLDAAGIKRAVVHSTAYSYGRPGREPQNEYEKVREENDWVAAEVRRYPKRLIAFCGFNPLKDYAMAELKRCAAIPELRHGIKMHFGNSDVQLEKAEHIEKLKAIFRAANENRMSIAVHMRASFSLKRPYGPEQARAFLDQLMPLATDITVQIAHMGSAGPGYNDPQVDSVMEVFVEAFGRRSPSTENLWFDLTTVAHPNNPPERKAMLAKRIRQIGAKRVLYGTDAALSGNLVPKDSWLEVPKLDLTRKEVKQIARNRAPYVK